MYMLQKFHISLSLTVRYRSTTHCYFPSFDPRISPQYDRLSWKIATPLLYHRPTYCCCQKFVRRSST